LPKDGIGIDHHNNWSSDLEELVCMPFVVGGIAMMVALAAGVLARVDPFACLTRALLAFVLGWIGALLWQVLLTVIGYGNRVELTTQVLPVEEEQDRAA
jgi:hypothetical protein